MCQDLWYLYAGLSGMLVLDTHYFLTGGYTFKGKSNCRRKHF